MVTTETLDFVKKIFAAHLEQRELRKTAERFAILEEIYSRTDHFEAEQLYLDLKEKKVNISFKEGKSLVDPEINKTIDSLGYEVAGIERTQ